MTDLIENDISHEEWRQYSWFYEYAGETIRAHYKIFNPQTLYVRRGGSTHRVVDSEGVAHCVPAVGELGCVLTWKNPDDEVPVNF